MTLKRFEDVARKCRNRIDVTRLWNLADDTGEPEAYFDILLTTCPWAFKDRHDSNSMLFAYA